MPAIFALSPGDTLLSPKRSSYLCVFSFAAILPETNHHTYDLSLGGKNKVLSFVTKEKPIIGE